MEPPQSAQDSSETPKTLISSSLQVSSFSDELTRSIPPRGFCSSEAPKADKIRSLGPSNSASDSPLTHLNGSPVHASPYRSALPRHDDHGNCGENAVESAETSCSSSLITHGSYGSFLTSDRFRCSSSSPLSRDRPSVFACPTNESKPLMLHYDDTGTESGPHSFGPFFPILPMGAGLANMGNTCFLNAIIQCFTHTVPFVRGLWLEHGIPTHHEDQEFCILRAVRSHIYRAFFYSGKVMFPDALVQNLSSIRNNRFLCSCAAQHSEFCWLEQHRAYGPVKSSIYTDQQEDAHEFLQCLLDKLDTCWSKCRFNAESKSPPGDTLVKQIFGGRLVSQLRCCKCGHCSYTYEPLIDLSLEIEDVDDLDGALNSFTKVEKIEDADVKITCDSCKERVPVEKQLMIDQAPRIIALHLKRFKSDGYYVEKIDKGVEYPLELDLAPYTVGGRSQNVELRYELYAVVVHIGFSSTSGHYFCYICAAPGRWFRFDDSKVTRVQQEVALAQRAYILFYAKKGTPWPCSLLVGKFHGYDVWNTSPKSVLEHTEPISTLTANKDAVESGDMKGKDSTLPSNGSVDEVCEADGVVERDQGTANVPSLSPLSIHEQCRKHQTIEGEISKSKDVGTSQPICGGECDAVGIGGAYVHDEDSVSEKICIYPAYGDDMCDHRSKKREEINLGDRVAAGTANYSGPSSPGSQSSDALYSEERTEVQTHPTLSKDSKMKSRIHLWKGLKKAAMYRRRQEAFRKVRRFPTRRRLILQATVLSNQGSVNKKRKTF